MGDDGGALILIGVGLIAGLIVGSFVVFYGGINVHEKEAVKAGAAYYQGDSQTGKSTFKWKGQNQ